MRQWQLQTARRRLSEVIGCAKRDGPQEIAVRGKAAAVILSVTDYERITASKPSFVEFLRASPLFGIDLDLERDTSPTR